MGLIPGSGRSPGEGNRNPLLYSCPWKSHGQRSLPGHSPWGCKELDTTARLKYITAKHIELQYTGLVICSCIPHCRRVSLKQYDLISTFLWVKGLAQLYWVLSVSRVSSKSCNQGDAWHCILSSRHNLEGSAFKTTNFWAEFCFLQSFGPRTTSVCHLLSRDYSYFAAGYQSPSFLSCGASSCCLLIKNSKRNSPNKANGTTLCNITIILYWLEATHGTYQYQGRGYHKGLIISRQG